MLLLIFSPVSVLFLISVLFVVIVTVIVNNDHPHRFYFFYLFLLLFRAFFHHCYHYHYFFLLYVNLLLSVLLLLLLPLLLLSIKYPHIFIKPYISNKTLLIYSTIHFYHCQELNDKDNDKNNLCYIAIKMWNMQIKWIPPKRKKTLISNNKNY